MTAEHDDLWAFLQPPADEARRLRDQGAADALNAADLRARGAAEQALRDLAESGVVFSSDDLHERVGSPLACSSSVMGSLFLAAAKRGEIEHVGHARSKRPSSHGREVKTWRGTGPLAPPAGDPRGATGVGGTPDARRVATHAASAPSTHGEFPQRSSVENGGSWTVADTPAACERCQAPAFMRLDGRPRHKTDCAA